MSRPRKVAWLKPSGRVFKALIALDAAGGKLPRDAMTKIFAGLYGSVGPMQKAQSELFCSGLLARVVVLTDAGRAAISHGSGPVKVERPAKTAKPTPQLKVKAAPKTRSGIGSTGAGHAWRGRKTA